MRLSGVLWVTFCVGACSGEGAAAAVPALITTEEAALRSTPPAGGARAGAAVALSGDGLRALVGSPGAGGGTARVFRRSGTTWTEEATLPYAGGAFGASVALSSDGSRALVGAPDGDDGALTQSGLALTFVRSGTTWSLDATLQAADREDFDGLGTSVALSADGMIAVVGVAGDDDGLRVDAGTARVFVRGPTVWTEEATLAAADGVARALMGASIAISADGSRALVGAPRDNAGALTLAGRAHVFRRSGTTWTLEASLTAADAASDDAFGESVALAADGARALVGASGDDGAPGMNAGSVRVFLRTLTSWTAEATVWAPDGAANDRFGGSVALSSDGVRAVAGAAGDDAPADGAGSARILWRSGTAWAHSATLVASGAAAGDALGSSVAMSADGTRVLSGAPAEGATDTGSVRAFVLESRAIGAMCATDDECGSGFCTDGVCCMERCGGVGDCSACVASLTGGPSGTCAALSATVAPTVTCRPAATTCDAPETCTAGSTACPADTFAPPTTVCRAAAMPCDAPESCTGASTVCPTDAARPSGFTCRTAVGPCDAVEVCDGSTMGCPGDALAAPGSVCGTGMGDCSLPAICTGSSPVCPSAGVRPAGTACRAASSPCDLADTCDGISQLCVDRFASAGTVCAASSSEVCDAPDVCTGTSADCVPTFVAGVECRPSAGACDPPEVCTGTTAACGPDVVSPAATVCRAASDMTCDPVESCDGLAATCPADVTMCVAPDGGTTDAGARDAGTDTGVDRDTGSAVDAGATPPTAVAGCACRARGPAASQLGGPVMLLVAAFATSRTRRRRGPLQARAALARP